MSKEEKNKVMPKLRFPEFSKAGDWKVKKLGQLLFKGKLGGNYENSETRGGLPVIKMGNLERGSININKLQFLPIGRDYDEDDVLKKGDLLLNTRNTLELVGKVAIWREELPKALYNSNLLRLTFHEDFVGSNYFMNYLLNTQTMLYAIRSFATGTTSVAAIYTKDLSKLELFVPSPSEQQKIADCLSSLDELITAEIQQLEALKAHKKGLMQQLFPAEGETVPKLRFAEFRDSGEWEETLLGKLIEIKGRIGYRGYTVDDIVAKGEGAITLSPSNFDGGGGLKFEKCTYISWAKYEESPEIMLEQGFTVLVKTGSSYGKTSMVKSLPEKCTINPQIVVLKPIHAEPFFLFLMISNTAVQKQIEETVVGGAIPTLSQESISKFKVFVPSIAEQQKIASCLSSLDEWISAQAEKIECLKAHKKGLMQGLFPAN